MELLDRYLNAVKKQLPWQRQDDILAELRANLESQLEEKEAALGRPLTAAEGEAWVKSLGSPMQMAAHYQTQQYLIGPAFFPTYRHVLKLACSWGVILYSVITAATVFASKNPSGTALFEAFLRLPGVLITIAGWVTVAFAAVEYAVTHGHIPADKLGPLGEKICDHGWSPAGLPSLDARADGKKPKSFAQAVAEVTFEVFFLGWILLVPQHPWLLFGPGAAILHASPYELAPVWMQFYWCVVALNILQVGWHIENLMRGSWNRRQPIRHIIFKSLGLLACLFVLFAPQHVTILLRHPALDQTAHGAQLADINFYVYRSFLLITVIATAQLLWDLGRLIVDARRKRAAAAL